MTDKIPGELEYPADHREAARELLLQKHALQAVLHGPEERLKTLRHRAWLAGTRLTWVGVGIAVVAGICVFTGLVDGKVTSVIAGGGLLVVLIAVFVATRARQQIDHITQQQEAVFDIDAALNGLKHDINDLEQWQSTVRVRILQRLENKVSADTKRDYFILILGTAMLIWMLAFSLS